MTKIWTKQKEIAALLDLAKGDTYFADTFEMGQLDIMSRNIENDFPLLSGTIADPEEIIQTHNMLQGMEEKMSCLKQDLLDAKNNHKAEVDHLKWTIDMLLLKIFKFNLSMTMSEKPERVNIDPAAFEFEGINDLSREQIVRLKFNNRIPWDDDDIAFIMEQIKKP
jgi:hypothetical protein